MLVRPVYVAAILVASLAHAQEVVPPAALAGQLAARTVVQGVAPLAPVTGILAATSTPPPPPADPIPTGIPLATNTPPPPVADPTPIRVEDLAPQVPMSQKAEVVVQYADGSIIGFLIPPVQVDAFIAGLRDATVLTIIPPAALAGQLPPAQTAPPGVAIPPPGTGIPFATNTPSAILSPNTPVPPAISNGRSRVNVVSWLRVDPLRPRVVYAGGYSGLVSDAALQGSPACGVRSARSADAGATWRIPSGAARFLSLNDQRARAAHLGCFPPDPFILSPDGSDLFSLGYDPYCVSAYGCGPYLSHSADGGAHWADILKSNHLAGNYPTITGFSISQADPKRAYATFFDSFVGSGHYVARSDDGGAGWHVVTPDATAHPLRGGGELGSYQLYGQVLADPTARDTVYLGLGIPMPPRAVYLARSDDGGRSWGLLHLPLPVNDNVVSGDEQNAQGFQLATDPHLPGAVVLTVVNVPGVPPDRRWVSLDHGATWKRTVCPGDLRGTCPAYTLDNVFGAGKAYGFYADGVHPFAGAGPAGPRLALSDRLPCRGADLLDAGGGARAGDPAYLLCQTPLALEVARALPYNSDISRVGTLYRSADAGASWRKLSPTAGW